MMEQIAETEQWRLDGNCLKCRRAEHCGKPCTAQKRRKRAILTDMQTRHLKGGSNK